MKVLKKGRKSTPLSHSRAAIRYVSYSLADRDSTRLWIYQL
jgi:hypothetical protein